MNEGFAQDAGGVAISSPSISYSKLAANLFDFEQRHDQISKGCSRLLNGIRQRNTGTGMRKAIPIFFGAIILSSAASMAAHANPPATLPDTSRVAWQGAEYAYGSGEGAAISRTTYAALTDFVLAEIRKPKSSWHSVVLDHDFMAAHCVAGQTCEFDTAKFTHCKSTDQPAVIFDADETLLLNYGAEFVEIAQGVQYSTDLWQQWERGGARLVQPVPGAVEAVAALRKKHVKVIVITNRDAVPVHAMPGDPKDFADFTIEALHYAGLGNFVHQAPISEKDLFLAQELGDKGSQKDMRRTTVAREYCVLAMAGDQLGDFSDFFPGKPGAMRTATSKASISSMWGQGWFVLPNPVYGTAVPYPGVVDDVFPTKWQWTYQPSKP